MLALKIINTKEFMNALLKKEVFDNFQLREATIATFVSFEIHGGINKSYFENPQEINKDYCLWRDVKHFAFEMIKGNRLPKSIKIVFSADEDIISQISNNASALFINLTFENNEVTLITGISYKTFTMDKSVEFLWDQWVKTFFEENGIHLSEIEYIEE